MKIAFDVSFIRLESVGGFKSYVDYLLSGFIANRFGLEKKAEMIIITSNNNHRYYAENYPFKIINLDFDNRNHFKTIIACYQMVEKTIHKNRIMNLFIPAPVYPIKNNQIRKIVTIHDLRFKDLPETFSKLQILKRIISIRSVMKNSKQIVAITNFTKEKIDQHYPHAESKITHIPNPVNVDVNKQDPSILSALNIEENEYYYTVSRLDDFKNLNTLIEMYKCLKEKHKKEKVLIISGPSGNNIGEVKRMIKKYNLASEIILTGFISDEQRNALYANCAAFLFPSVYEGFGLPPIEAMFFKKRIIASNIEVIKEVTNNEVIYVNHPKDSKEWLEKIQSRNYQKNYAVVDVYKPEKIAKKYIDLFMKTYKE